MAAYAAQAGLPALVFVPAGKVAAGKLAQALAYGARTLLVDGDFDACLRLVREASEALVDRAAQLHQPVAARGPEDDRLRAAAAARLGAAGLDRRARRQPRQHVGVRQGAARGEGLGLIRRVPRVASVQAAGANPFYRSFRSGFRQQFTRRGRDGRDRDPHRRPGEPRPRRAHDPRDERRRDRRCADREILEAKAVVDAAGIGCEPASAASVAGARRLVREGVIRRGQSVVGDPHRQRAEGPRDRDGVPRAQGRPPQPAGARSRRGWPRSSGC